MTRAPSIVAVMGSRSLFGAERANIDLLRMMQETGARVTCIVRDEDWPENLKIRQFLDDHGLDWRTCPFASYPTWRYWRYWPHVFYENSRAFAKGNRLLKQICQEVGATHIHSFNPFLTVSFWPALKGLTLPLIYRCGERPVDHNIFYKIVWAWLRRRIKHVGTESNYIQGLLMEHGFDNEQVSVIPAPPPARVVHNNFKILPVSIDLAGMRFGYIGQVSEFKGVAFLIEALPIVLEEFPGTTLTIAGSLQDDWSRQLKENSEARFGSTCVAFIGSVEDVPGMLENCDVLVAPSLKPEGYGLVAVEAKQAGRPSIVFTGGGLGELIVDGLDGIVVSVKTPEALAAAMLTYCRNPERARADGIAAKASLAERLGTDRYSERWRAIFDASMPKC